MAGEVLQVRGGVGEDSVQEERVGDQHGGDFVVEDTLADGGGEGGVACGFEVVQ